MDSKTGPTPKRVAFAKNLLALIREEQAARKPKVQKAPTINLKKASLQRVFEFGLKAIRKQGRPAMSGNTCVYRSHNGDKCIVGHMISDEQIAEHGIVNTRPVSMQEDAFKKLVGKNVKKLGLLKAMQAAHDDPLHDAKFLYFFEESMKRVAENFELTYKAPGTTLRA